MFIETSPIQVGIKEEYLNILKDKITSSDYKIHNILFSRGNFLFASFSSFNQNEYTLHRMYSQTKSLTGLAIGLLYDEGKIDLDRPLIEYFPEFIKEDTDEILLKQTVKDTLMMGTCVTCENWFDAQESDRVKLYFSSKHNRNLNEKFKYDSAGSYVLGALVEKITNISLYDYLYNKVLNKLEYFSSSYMLKTLDKRCWGDSGLISTSIAMNRLGRFYLDKGVINGERLISEEYLNSSTKPYLSTLNEKMRCKRYGYGYQVWMIKDGYAFLGMGNQLTLMFPKQDIVVSLTGNCFDEAGARDELFDLIYDIVIHSEDYDKNNVKKDAIYRYELPFELKTIHLNNSLEKYNNINYINNECKLVQSFCLNSTNNQIKLSLNINGNINDLIFKDNTNIYVPLVDYSIYRKTKLPDKDSYIICLGIKNINNNEITFHSMIQGLYLGNITFNITFNKDYAILKVKSYIENFFNDYNGEFIFKNEITK